MIKYDYIFVQISFSSFVDLLDTINQASVYVVMS